MSEAIAVLHCDAGSRRYVTSGGHERFFATLDLWLPADGAPQPGEFMAMVPHDRVPFQAREPMEHHVLGRTVVLHAMHDGPDGSALRAFREAAFAAREARYVVLVPYRR